MKNTSKNIFIDEEGNYFRTGEFLKWDCNIAEKMSLKESLLAKVLDGIGIDYIPIRSIVVFTNNHIEVQNRYRQVRTCFVSQLPHIIDGFRLEDIFSENDMEDIRKTIELSIIKEAYPFEFDVKQYKIDFATLLATLEFSKTEAEIVQSKKEENVTVVVEELKTNFESHSFTNWFISTLSSKQVQHACSVAATLAVTLTSSMILANTINKGGF